MHPGQELLGKEEPKPPSQMPAKKKKISAKRKKSPEQSLPPASDWRTTDAEEILRRQVRAREEQHGIENLGPEHPVFSNFRVASPSGMTYEVEIRDIVHSVHACTCPDYRINGLGTCKHTEAVRLWLKRRQRGEMRVAAEKGSPRVDLVPGGARNPRLAGSAATGGRADSAPAGL